jgi:hypothetical protein
MAVLLLLLVLVASGTAHRHRGDPKCSPTVLVTPDPVTVTCPPCASQCTTCPANNYSCTAGPAAPLGCSSTPWVLNSQSCTSCCQCPDINPTCQPTCNATACSSAQCGAAAPFYNPASGGCSSSSAAWPGRYCCNTSSCVLPFCQSSAPRNRTFVFSNRCPAAVYVGTQGFNLLSSNG